MRVAAASDLDSIGFAKGGATVPLIAQDARTGEVLILGFADREALARSRLLRRDRSLGASRLGIRPRPRAGYA